MSKIFFISILPESIYKELTMKGIYSGIIEIILNNFLLSCFRLLVSTYAPNEILTRKNFSTHKILTRKGFGLTKFPGEKNLAQMHRPTRPTKFSTFFKESLANQLSIWKP